MTQNGRAAQQRLEANAGLTALDPRSLSLICWADGILSLTSEPIREASSSWPRLYLDTAEILDIADEHSDPLLVRRLSDAMWVRRVVLVISVEHLQDSLPRADVDAPARVAEAIEQFRLRAVVLRGPSEIEPWQDSTADIEIAPAANIREVLTHPWAPAVLNDLASAQDAIHSANLEFQEARSANSSKALTVQEHKLWFQVVVTLVRGWAGTDVDEVIAHWEQKEGVSLAPSSRALLREHLEPAAKLIATYADDPRFDDAGRMRILTNMCDSLDPAAFVRAPGLFLAGQLAGCRSKNSTRVPSTSDSVDGMHAMYFPYVNIATCDRQTYACLAPHLPKIVAPRKPTVIRNGRLAEVIGAVEAFPSVLAP